MTQWSLGVLVGLPAAGVVTAVALAMVIVGCRRRDWAFSDPPLRLIVGGFLLLAVPALTWTTEYHQWRPVTGRVERIESRLISAGDKGTSQKFAVRLAGDDREYGCDDTRCALVQPGHTLALSCVRVWQYTGTPGFDCTYVRADKEKHDA